MVTARGRHRRSESGHALVFALVALLMVSVAGALLAGSLLLHLRTARYEADDVRLMALADAAVAASLAELAASPGSRGLTERDFGGGSIASDIARPQAGWAVVVARAAYGRSTRRVRAEVRLTAAGPRVVAWRPLPATAAR
jgi:Tfp pilus assembly protein PilX